MQIDKYTLLKKFGMGGCSGIESRLVKSVSTDDSKERFGIVIKDNHHLPEVGQAIWVGDPGTDNWWRTSVITKILEKKETDESIEICFKTLNSEYTWIYLK